MQTYFTAAPHSSSVPRTSIFAILLFLLLPLSLKAQAPPVEGRVINDTTQRPVSGAVVQYVVPQQGMQPVAEVKTDAEGRYRFENVSAPAGGPALIRVEFQGATYTAPPIMPGQPQAASLDVHVFDAASQAGSISIAEHAIFLHPSGESLSVMEQIVIQNNSKPPRTFVNPQGTYQFTLPGAPRESLRASIQGALGLPLPQAPVAQQKENSFAIAYAIKPGATELRLEYRIDYKSPFDFRKFLDVLPEKAHIITPGNSVEISGKNLVALGADPANGYVGYEVTPVDNTISVQVSGEAPLDTPSDTVASAQEAGALVPIPDPINKNRVLYLTLLGLVMAVGFIYLYTR